MKYFVTKYGRKYVETTAQQNNGHRLSVIGNPSSLLTMSCKSTSAVVAEMRNSSLPSTDSDSECGSPKQNASRRSSVDKSVNVAENTNHCSNGEETPDSKPDEDSAAKYYATRSSTTKNKRLLSVKTLQLAIDCCQKYINDLEHGDLDVHDQVCLLIYYACLNQLHIMWLCLQLLNWLKPSRLYCLNWLLA